MHDTHMIHRSNIGTDRYEPLNGFEAILDGDPAASTWTIHTPLRKFFVTSGYTRR